MDSNKLFFGDNLDILRQYVPDKSVDLIYLDPPFQSNQNYNVLFETRSGEESPSQVQAFKDTWKWDQAAARNYEQVVTEGPRRVSETMQALKKIWGNTDMLAYLSMMGPRLVEMHRVLSETGSIYLHCDPTASHYLKTLMDSVFGPDKFRSEIIWKRTSAHNDAAQGREVHGHVHDTILFYTKGEEWTWNDVYMPYSQEYLEKEYDKVDENGRRFTDSDLTAARSGGNTEYEFRVKKPRGTDDWEADLDDEYEDPKEGWVYKGVPPYSGRIWVHNEEKMKQLAKEGKLYYRSTGMIRRKNYADEMPGVHVQDIWTDISPLSAKAAERLGYPTQKPTELLERIIKSSSDEGDVVMDPFCGCGTAIAAAERLDREWIGIDVTHLSITLIKHRLTDSFDDVDYEVLGEPTSTESAEALAKEDRHQFEYWALGLVGARPDNETKGADKGIDGKVYFHDAARGDTKEVILSVKSGKNVGVQAVRDLRGVVKREDSEIGVLITLAKPTDPMIQEAATGEFYKSPGFNTKHPKIQIITIEELVEENAEIDMPPIHQVGATYRKAPESKPREQKQGELDI